MNEKELQFIAAFDSIIPQLKAWGNWVDNLLTNEILIDLKNEIQIYPKYRIKSQRSILDKAFYKKQNYSDPLFQIVDKVATRVVFLKSNDVVFAKEIILNFKEWDAIITKNVFEEIEDKPKVFDYQSVHIVVYPLENQDGFENAGRLGCEIQLRSLLQHAFAEVSHDNIYKGPYQNDAVVLRQLSKSMALMEATDDYFKNIYAIMTDETRIYPAFLNELALIYKDFVPTYSKNKLNVDFNDKFLILFKERPVQIQEVRTFVQKRLTEFSRAIKISNGYLFQQPVSILIGFYLLKSEKFLNDNWPVDQNILTDVYRAFNQNRTNY